MLPIIPLPQSLAEFQNLHEQAAILGFVLLGAPAISIIVRTVIDFSGSTHERRLLKMALLILLYAIGSLIFGLYFVGPLLLIGIGFIIYLIIKAFIYAWL